MTEQTKETNRKDVKSAFISVLKKYHYILAFILLSVIIIQPFRSGYFFLLDNVPYTINSLNLESYLGTSIGWLFFDGITPYIFTAAISQKIFFTLSLILLGAGGYKIAKKWGIIPAYFAGLFSVMNPFVYSRLLDGQVNIILSFALLLWGIIFLIKYYNSRALKPLIVASLLFGLAINFMTHSIFISLAVFFVLFIFNGFERGERLKHFLKNLLAVSIILLLNANWIAAQLFFKVNAIDSRDFLNFASESGEAGLYFNTLSLHGYWGEAESRFMPSTFLIEHWQIVFGLIFIIILIGVFYGIKNKETRKNSIAFLIIAIISYILAMGIASKEFGFITEWMYDHVPYYKGLREPQKWAGVLLICYLWFTAIGVSQILELKFFRKAKVWWGIALCLLPVLYTSSMLFGFMGQLKAFDYPKDWYRINEEFFAATPDPVADCSAKTEGESNDCYQTLALPWHQYIGFRFAGRIIANPMQGFFHNTKVLMGDNIEIGTIYTQSSRPESRIIEVYVGPGSDRALLSEKPFAESLQSLGIKYVLLAREVDWEGYERYLSINPNLEIKLETDNLIIYEINE